MKELLYFLGIAAAGVVGYMAEPSLRSTLTDPLPAAHAPLAIDLSVVDPASLPERVLVNVPVKVTDASSGITMTIDAGNRLKLVRLEGDLAVVGPSEGLSVGRVNVADTDLIQQLVTSSGSRSRTPEAPPTPPVTPPVTPPATEPAVTPEPAPAEMAANETPVPPAETAAPTEPAAPVGESGDPTAMAETPAPAAPAAPAGNTDVVSLMQDSVKSAQINEFKFDQVLNWEASGEETIDGETFQTGLASYKAETIFGVKTIQAKALVKNGKVARWIWPKSGLEIK